MKTGKIAVKARMEQDRPVTFKTDQRFIWLVTIIYSLIVLFTMTRHELWRDEMQAWLIARDSISLFDLFKNIRPESHPALWYLLLYPLTRLTHNPIAMQLLQWAIATTAVYVFVRFSPFTKFHKGLFVSGFFPLFEYGVKSRAYALGMLLTFCLAALFARRPRSYSLIALSIFFLSQTSVFGLFIALAFISVLIFELTSKTRLEPSAKINKWHMGQLALLAAGGVSIAILQMAPRHLWRFWGPHASTLNMGWVQRTYHGLNQIFFSPIQDLFYHFLSYDPSWLDPVLFLVLLLSMFALIRAKRAAVFFWIGVIAFLGGFYSKFFGYTWHHGHFYILFISALWLSCDASGLETWNKYQKYVLTMILVLQLIAGGRVTLRDWYFPYSSSKETARYIHDHDLEDLPMAGDVDARVSTLTGYLDNQMYYPLTDVTGSFVNWENKRQWETDAKRIQKIVDHGNRIGRDMLLVLSYKLDLIPRGLEEVKGFGYTIEERDKNYLYSDETYYLYRFHHSDHNAQDRDKSN